MQRIILALLSPLLALLLLALFPAMTMAKEFVLSDVEAASRIDEWSVSSTDIGIAAAPPFSVKKRSLHGGKQEGMELIEIDNGRTTISLIPTRGMSVFRVRSGDITLGWNSPVKQIVNPAFIELDSRGGLGWLDGFNEWLVRCGFEWAGHPGIDNETFAGEIWECACGDARRRGFWIKPAATCAPRIEGSARAASTS